MIVRLQGGVGNQMFQYAFGRSVSKARNEELFFEKRSDMVDGVSRFPYSLDAFKTNVTFAADVGGHPQYEERIFAYDEMVYTAPANPHFSGYWQTEKYYFEPKIIHEELSLRDAVSEQTQRVADEILATSNSAFVHVRRGDYLLPDIAPWIGNLTLDYYKKAIECIRERMSDVTFFIFSDDPDWCRQNFQGCRVIDHNKGGRAHEDLFLMSICKQAVIANSSFSWWGAWLGDFRGKVVISPYRWFADIRHIKWDPAQSDITPTRWIRI
jgi:hypothetical protein